MTLSDFNIITAKTDYTYRRNPVMAGSFMILKKQDTERYEPIGEYTVLDKEEDADLSEKKVMNLVSVLNGDQKLMEIGAGTKKRMLYKPFPRLSEDEKSKVIFYTLSEGAGVSEENAILTIAEDIEYDA